MTDDHEPQAYWDRPENTPTNKGFWKVGTGWPTDLPKGAATRTARGSLGLAWLWTAMFALRIVQVGVDRFESDLTLVWVVMSPIAVGLAILYWRSWRILRRHEAEHGTPSVEPMRLKPTRRVAMLLIALGGTAILVGFVIDLVTA